MTGTPELRQAISDKLHARERPRLRAGRDHRDERGEERDLQLAFAATLGTGDEVIIPAPYWVSYPDMALACDGVPVTVACPEAQGFKLDAGQLEAAITPRTRWLILNSPANPTGATYSADEYRALAEVLARHPDVLVMTDDIYEHIRFDGGIAPHLLAAAPELREPDARRSTASPRPTQ